MASPQALRHPRRNGGGEPPSPTEFSAATASNSPSGRTGSHWSAAPERQPLSTISAACGSRPRRSLANHAIRSIRRLSPGWRPRSMVIESTPVPGRPPMTVNILTGFLGSGKTSLLKRLLQQPQLSDVAVIINEFGEVGIDHLLVEEIDEEIVLLKSGCVCCTIRSDLKN